MGKGGIGARFLMEVCVYVCKDNTRKETGHV